MGAWAMGVQIHVDVALYVNFLRGSVFNRHLICAQPALERDRLWSKSARIRAQSAQEFFSRKAGTRRFVNPAFLRPRQENYDNALFGHIRYHAQLEPRQFSRKCFVRTQSETNRHQTILRNRYYAEIVDTSG